MSRKKPLSQREIGKYTKLVLGRTASHGESPFDVCSSTLAVDGRIRKPGLSSRQHCYENAGYILRRLAAEPVKALERKLKLTPELRAAQKDSFLFSYEWRRVRMLALKKYGPKCQCCGATPQTGGVMNVDHIKPRKLFPHLALDVDNLQILCHECNHGKGNWDQTDWRQEEVDPEVISMLRDIAKHG